MDNLKDIWSEFALREGIHLTQTIVNGVAVELRRQNLATYTVEKVCEAYQRLKRREHEQRSAQPVQKSPSPQKTSAEIFEERKAAAFAEFDKPIHPHEDSFARLQRVGRQREQWMKANTGTPPEPSKEAHPDTLRRTRAEIALRRTSR
jgi:hypothetical protein